MGASLQEMRNWAFLLCALGVAGCSLPMPPLLRGATAAGGGWYGGCPPANEVERQSMAGPEAISPELNQRLNAQFPDGTPATKLVSALVSQGFAQTAPCANDKTIRHAVFRGGRSIFETWAEVAWKEDSDGRIVWVKGSVAYTGP